MAFVDAVFVSGEPPTGVFEPPSPELATRKAEFGASRVARWFDKSWTNF